MSTIPAGTRLGPYEIIAKLGEGGMGEVYRARDTKLQRDVAIKVLPATIAIRSDALARFEREAQSIAALSHPNILAIHDFGASDGLNYAVTELLEGETLRESLAGGALPVRRAIDYAVQIARGLAAAHDRGIVHRDLKPENIFVTPDHRIKILDFGLARHDAAVMTEGTAAATVNSPTEPGTVLGTMGYMAPEQVRGSAIDGRADIFSFGAVLFEMVTGDRAFAKSTPAESMAAVLRDDPTELLSARGVPPAIDRLIRRCLEKKPEARFRSAHDLAFALEAVSTPSTVTTSAHVAVGDSKRARRLVLPAAALAAIAAAFALGVWYAGARNERPTSGPASDPPVFRRLTFDDEMIDRARFAPDGRTIVYGSARADTPPKLLMTRLESPGSTALPVQNAVIYAVSPEAEVAVGLNPRGATLPMQVATLVRMPLFGGASRPVLDNVRFAEWSPVDGTLAVVHVVGSQERLEYPIGTVLYATEGQIGTPRISPRGDTIAYLEWPVKDDNRGSVAIVDRRGQRRTLTRSWEALSGIAWAPSGDEIWFTAAASGMEYSLWGVTLDGKERRIYSAPGGLLLQDIYKDGRTVITRFTRTSHVEAVLEGAPPRDVSWRDRSFARDISRDGSRILISFFGEGSSPNYDVFVRGVHDDQAVRIGEGQPQQFSPSGDAVLSVIHGPPSSVVIQPIGPGTTRTVPTGSVTVTNARWIDARRLLLIGTEPAKQTRGYIVGLDGSAPQAITPEGITWRIDQVALSHDGTRVAFTTADGAINIFSTAGGTAVAARGFAPGEVPIDWTADDRRLLIRGGALGRDLVAIDPVTGARSAVRTIAPSNPALLGPFQVVHSADGRSYIGNWEHRQATLFLVENLK